MGKSTNINYWKHRVKKNQKGAMNLDDLGAYLTVGTWGSLSILRGVLTISWGGLGE